MGALANMKDTKIGQILTGAFGAFIGMVKDIDEYDENDDINKVISEVIKENPELSEELLKTAEAINYEQKKLEEQAREQFNTSRTFGIDLNYKDEDGYNKIPDKLDDIGAKVSEKEALKTNAKEREKGGKQRTRVYED